MSPRRTLRARTKARKVSKVTAAAPPPPILIRYCKAVHSTGVRCLLAAHNDGPHEAGHPAHDGVMIVWTDAVTTSAPHPAVKTRRSHAIRVRVTAEEHDGILLAAAERGLDISGIVRGALRTFLNLPTLLVLIVALASGCGADREPGDPALLGRWDLEYITTECDLSGGVAFEITEDTDGTIVLDDHPVDGNTFTMVLETQLGDPDVLVGELHDDGTTASCAYVHGTLGAAWRDLGREGCEYTVTDVTVIDRVRP